MNPTLAAFVRAHFHRSATGLVPLKEFSAAFADSLPEADRDSWTRARLVGELARGGFAIGIANRVQCIAGLAPRRAHWEQRDGRLELAYGG